MDRNNRWLVGVDRDGETPRLRLFDATTLKWTIPLLDASAIFTSAHFDDRGAHVMVRGTVPVNNTPTRRLFLTVYRTADGATMYHTLDGGALTGLPYMADTMITDSGYLLGHTRAD